MANNDGIEVGNLPDAALPLSGNENTIVDQGNVTKKTAVQNLIGDSGVIAGTYTNPTLGINSKGLVTSAVNGSGGGGSGTVSQVNTGTGLTGGPITTTGTISFAPITNNTMLGNVAGSSQPPVSMTSAQVTALLNQFTTGLQGVVPASGGGTTNFLRADGSWAAPAGGGGAPVGATYITVSLDGTLTNERTLAAEASVLALTDGGANSTMTVSVAANGITNAKLAQMAANTFKANNTAGLANATDITVAQAKTMLNLAGTNTGDQTITLTGDVTGSGTGSFAATIANNAVTNAKAAQMATLTIKGNNTGGTANALDLTVAQVNAILPVFTSTLNGAAPLSGGGTTNFLRADGAWAAPGGSGSPGGANTQVQFNDSSAFGGDADFTWDKTNNILTVGSSTTAGVVVGGTGTASGNGATVTLKGGLGGATSGNGGAAVVQGGAPQTSGVGGAVTLTGGAGIGTNQGGGDINITGGAPTGNGNTGRVLIAGAAGTGSGVAGNVQITGGAGNVANTGGIVSLTGGTGGTTGTGAAVNILGGAGGSVTGQGGGITIQGGTPTAGAGADITLNASNGVGVSQNGGNIKLNPGDASGGVGVHGLIQGVQSGGSTVTVFDSDMNIPVARLNFGTSASSTTFWCGNGTWSTPSGGSATPGGSNQNIQFNNSSAFGGISNLNWNGTDLVAGAAAGNFNIVGATGTGASNGSSVQLNGGPGGSGTSNGGGVAVTAGNAATAGNGIGGAVNITTGQGNGTGGLGGSGQLLAGDGGSAGASHGGTWLIQGGGGNGTGRGGDIALTGGATSGSGRGGNIQIVPGASTSGAAGIVQGTIPGGATVTVLDASMNIPVARLNSGTSASSSTFWRGDGAWSLTTESQASIYVSGNFYGPPAIVSSTGATTANTLYFIYVPIYTIGNISLSNFFARVQTGIAGNLQMAAYTNASGQPGTIIGTATASTSTASTGTKIAAPSGGSFNITGPGIWIGVCTDVGVTMNNSTSGIGPSWGGSSSTGAYVPTSGWGGWSFAGTFGTWPSPIVSPTRAGTVFVAGFQEA